MKKIIGAATLAVGAISAVGTADASRPPGLDAAAAEEAFAAAAAPLGSPFSPACTTREGVATEFVCYAWVSSDATLDASDSIVSAVVRNIDGTATVEDMVVMTAGGGGAAVATTTAGPEPATLAREAELAVRACIDGVYPITFIVADLNTFGDASSLDEVQEACDEAYTQLQVEDAPIVVDLNLCIAELNLQLSAVEMDWVLDQELDAAKLDLFEIVRSTNGAAMTSLIDSGVGTCNDDVEPSL